MAQTLLDWVKQAEIDAGARPGVSTTEAQRIKDLKREVKELRRADEILKLASAFFAQATVSRPDRLCWHIPGLVAPPSSLSSRPSWPA